MAETKSLASDVPSQLEERIERLEDEVVLLRRLLTDLAGRVRIARQVPRRGGTVHDDALDFFVYDVDL